MNEIASTNQRSSGFRLETIITPKQQADSNAPAVAAVNNDNDVRCPRNRAREEFEALQHYSGMFRAFAQKRGWIASLFAPFTARVRAFHLRLSGIEAMLHSILADRSAALENKRLAEELVHLKTAADNEIRRLADNYEQQRARAEKLLTAMLVMKTTDSLSILAEIVKGGEAKDGSLAKVKQAEELLARVLSQDEHDFGPFQPFHEMMPSASATQKKEPPAKHHRRAPAKGALPPSPQAPTTPNSTNAPANA